MKFRRVLVMAMAIVMMVSACAPSVLAAYKPETKHEHLNDVLNNPELVEKYEEIKATVEYVAKDIEENHEEYYANGYAYALENGYIGTAVEVIEVLLWVLPAVELDGAEMTDEFREDLEVELDALVPTLEKLLAILESGEASEFDGFVEAALTLEGDLYTHLNNIYAILEQASIDLNQFILVPAFYEALRVLEEEVIPALEAVIDAYVDAVVDHVVNALTPYYNEVVRVIGIAQDTYELLVETIVKINLFVENTIDTVIGTYNALVAKLAEIYGNIEDAVRAAANIYNHVINAIVVINGVIENIGNTVIAVVNAYEYAVELLINVYGSVENAIIVAGQVFDYIVNIVVESKETIEIVVAELYADILDMIENGPEAANDFASYMAMQLTAYVYGILIDLEGFVLNAHSGAISGNYELKNDSFYVALGNSPFGEALAGKLNLTGKYAQYGIMDAYLDAVAGADLITLKVDNTEIVDFTSKQVAGAIGGLVRNNEKLMSFYEHPIIGGYVQNAIDESGIDVDAHADELDWSKYLSAADQKTLNNVLALVKAELIANGMPEFYYIDLNPMVDEALEENGLAGLPGISIDIEPIEIPVADLAVYAIESVLYAYARFANDLDAILENICAVAPEATVVLVGISNPLAEFDIDFGAYGIDCIDFADCVAAADVLVQTFDSQLYLKAMMNANVVFVPENDADAIYNAINVYCEHVYDDCLDAECNRCLAVRDDLGHSFNNYIYNDDATCDEDGTETSKCDFCDAEDTRTAIGTAIGHDWEEKTCTKPETCKTCGETRGTAKPHDYENATCTDPKTCKDCGQTSGSALGHKYGPWTVTEEATRKNDGSQERKCRVCGHIDREVIPMILPKHSVGTIVTVIISAIMFSCAVFSFILWRLRKKDILK